MTESAHPDRVIQAQQFLTHVRSNETNQAAAMLAESVTYRVLGDHALAGTFVGPHEVVGHFADVAGRTNGGFDLVKWQDMMLGVNHVAALVDTRMEANGRVFVGRLLALMKFDGVDKIDEVTVFFEDVLAAERFYGRR